MQLTSAEREIRNISVGHGLKKRMVAACRVHLGAPTVLNDAMVAVRQVMNGSW